MRVVPFFRILLRVAAFAGAVGGARAGEIRYRIQDLGAQTHAIRLNVKGEVALTRKTGSESWRAFLFSSGKFEEIPTPADTNGHAKDLNDAGQLVGYYSPQKKDGRLKPWTAQRAFVYQEGNYQNLAEGGRGPTPLMTALLIGQDGSIVGEPIDGPRLVLTKGQTATPLEPPADFKGTATSATFVATQIAPNGEILGYAQAFSTSGQEVGQSSTSSRTQPFIFRDGQMHDATALGGLSGMNRRGQIVGKRRDKSNRSEAFFFDGEKRHDLGIPGNFKNSRAAAINEAGVIVGTANTMKPGEPGYFYVIDDSRAYIYRDGAWQDLNECVDLQGTQFSVLTTAEDINDRGQIIGQAVGPGGYRAYLLTPVTEAELAAKP